MSNFYCVAGMSAVSTPLEFTSLLYDSTLLNGATQTEKMANDPTYFTSLNNVTISSSYSIYIAKSRNE